MGGYEGIITCNNIIVWNIMSYKEAIILIGISEKILAIIS